MSLLNEATVAIEEVNEALQDWSRVFANMWDMAEGFFGSITFTEAVTLADLLYVAGDPKGALTLIEGWRDHDEDWEDYAEEWDEAATKYRTYYESKEKKS